MNSLLSSSGSEESLILMFPPSLPTRDVFALGNSRGLSRVLRPSVAFMRQTRLVAPVEQFFSPNEVFQSPIFFFFFFFSLLH